MENIIKLDTKNTSLIFSVAKAGVELTHYGKRVNGNDFVAASAINFDADWGRSNDRFTALNMPYSSVGDGLIQEALVEIVDKNGLNSTRFTYVGHRFIDGGIELNGLPCAHTVEKTLIVEYLDKFNDIKLEQFYSVFNDCDVISVHQKLTNNGDAVVSIRRLMSVQIDISGLEHKCVSFHGAWSRERYRKENVVAAGAHVNQSMQGHSSNNVNPFFMLERNDNKGIYAFNLVYSGNHKSIVEAHEDVKNTRILCGMSDYCFDWTLNSGESFESPEAVMLFAPDEQEVTTQMHKFVMNHIIDPKFAKKSRPVLINNWEGTHFGFDEEKLLAIADKAVQMGVELFVLDDGWFGHRDDDHSSLGDWFDHRSKLNGSLGELADKIRARGLEFGIWVEPEMICEDSELYRKHPEYTMAIPGLDPIRRRHQLMLDLVNPEVQDYLIREIGDVIERCKAYYVKWDCNRFFSDVYSPVLKNNGEYFHRYELGLYRLISALKERFPDVLFEGCASGGDRFDLGIMRYMPQTWASDMTEPCHRLRIQEGTLIAYPQSTMGSHVTAWKNATFESKFDIACLGAFGYELDPTKLTDDQIALFATQIKYYKEHRDLLLFGQYYRIESIFGKNQRSSWIIVSEDKSEAMAFIADTVDYINEPSSCWRFTGLDDNATYSVEMRSELGIDDEFIFKGTTSGSVLNNCELNFGSLFKVYRGNSTVDHQAHVRFGTPLATRLFYIKKI